MDHWNSDGSRNAKQHSHLENVWRFLIKLNMHVLYELALSLLGIYPNAFSKTVHAKICL